MKKVSVFSNFLKTRSVLGELIRNVRRQRKFLAAELGSQLEELRNNDGSIDSDDINKITNYYGLAVPCILGEALCLLRGKPMTTRERLTLTYQGAMTGLFDDFFDKEKLDDASILKFLKAPESIQPQNQRQELFLRFFKKAITNSHFPALTLEFLNKVYRAQIESKKQASPGSLSLDEIKNITVDKGGVSVLFYRSVLENPLTPEEESALYQMGGLMQFGNDIFDIYKDSRQHIDTLLSRARKVNDVRKQFREMMNTSFASVYETRYPSKNIHRFLRFFSMCLCARCFVCLDQLEKKEKTSDNEFKPARYSRQDLVCDMDKAANKRRTVRYFIINRFPAG